MIKNKNIEKKLLLFLLLVAYFYVAYTVMNRYDISCFFLEIFGVPCPGCGMTRALLSLLRFDFYQALKYNLGIFFMPYVFAYIFFDFKHKIHKYILAAIATIVFVNWIIKIILLI